MAKTMDDLHKLIQEMTLEQKIGATLTLGFAGTVPRKHIYEWITKYHCGGLRLSPIFRKFGNYVNPLTGETVVDLTSVDKVKDQAPPYMNGSDYKEILDELKEVAAKRPLGLPLHFSFDQEGGTSADYNFGGVNLFPKPMGLRASNDPSLAYEVAKAVSEQSLAVGFNFLHSPVLDVNVEPKNPEIYTRAYSDDATLVTEYAIASCKGLKEAGMIATGKHFPGRGDSPVDAHYELPVIDVDKETLKQRDLLPYRALIDKDLLPSIMIAHSIFPALDKDHVATVSKKIITGLLREEMGYKGVITTDSMTMGALAKRYGIANACAMALEAGCDLVLMKAENELVEETFQTIRDFVMEGRIPEEDLNKKVERILKMKMEYGMFETRNQDNRPEEVNNRIRESGLARRAALGATLPLRGSMKLPLPKEGKTLIIEQINKNVPNDKYWHYGYLYQKCMQTGANVDLFEIDYMVSEEDTKTVMEAAGNYDYIVLTNFYVRSRTANNELVKELQKACPGKVIVINNTPYLLSAPENMENVITTLATTPENLQVVADMLYGETKPKGTWPLSLTPEGQYV